MRTELQTLTHLVERTREYTLLYLDRMEGQDPHRRFACEGKELNTMFWLVAHLATTQNGLLLRATGGPFERFSWAKHFTVGTSGLPPAECPPYAEVRGTFDAVHAAAVAHLPTIDPAALDGPNITGMTVFGNTMRDVITHAIRHEGSHIGHLGWLCKLYGIRTM
ncbi:MAG: DinB family protein [Flavobacteriales bacterium]|nr:DinB family protein [Flavobacteriales bacterium]